MDGGFEADARDQACRSDIPFSCNLMVRLLDHVFSLHAPSIGRQIKPAQQLHDILVQRIQETCPSPWQIDTSVRLDVPGMDDPRYASALVNKSEICGLSMASAVNLAKKHELLISLSYASLSILSVPAADDINIAEHYPNLRQLNIEGCLKSEDEVVKLVSTLPQTISFVTLISNFSPTSNLPDFP